MRRDAARGRGSRGRSSCCPPAAAAPIAAFAGVEDRRAERACTAGEPERPQRSGGRRAAAILVARGMPALGSRQGKKPPRRRCRPGPPAGPIALSEGRGRGSRSAGGAHSPCTRPSQRHHDQRVRSATLRRSPEPRHILRGELTAYRRRECIRSELPQVVIEVAQARRQHERLDPGRLHPALSACPPPIARPDRRRARCRAGAARRAAGKPRGGWPRGRRPRAWWAGRRAATARSRCPRRPP